MHTSSFQEVIAQHSWNSNSLHFCFDHYVLKQALIFQAFDLIFIKALDLIEGFRNTIARQHRLIRNTVPGLQLLASPPTSVFEQGYPK